MSSQPEPALDNTCAFSPSNQSALTFLREVSAIYTNRFWFYFRMMVPAIVFGYIAVYATSTKAYAMARHAYLVGGGLNSGEAWAATALKTSGYLVSWLLYSFSFAAICAAIRTDHNGGNPEFEASFTVARRKTAQIFGAASVLFILTCLAFVLSILVGSLHAIVLRDWQSLPQIVSFSVMYIVMLTLLTCISRLALSVPAIVLDSLPIKRAMFLSDALTEGRNLALSLLLLESLGGAYLAFKVPFVCADLVWQLSPFSSPDWLGYVLLALGMSGSALIQPSLFIGLAHLYEAEHDAGTRRHSC
jgi:hypothetical protein